MDSISVNSNINRKMNEFANVKIERVIIKTETISMDDMIRENIDKKVKKNNILYTKLTGFLDEIKKGEYTFNDYAEAIAEFVNNDKITRSECECMSKIFEAISLYKENDKNSENSSSQSWADIDEDDNKTSFESFLNKNLLKEKKEKENKNEVEKIDNSVKPSYAKAAATKAAVSPSHVQQNNVVITRKTSSNNNSNTEKSSKKDRLEMICNEFGLDYKSVQKKIFVDGNNLFKNIMCNNYDNKCGCTYDNKCNYAHGQKELDAFRDYLRNYSENNYSE